MRKGTLIVAIAGVVAAMLAIPALASKGVDTNSDRIPDRWEKRHKLSLKVNQAPRDQDKDGLRNLREYREGTNPRNADTDGDGIGDRPECNGKHGQQGQQGSPPPDNQQQPPQGSPTS